MKSRNRFLSLIFAFFAMAMLSGCITRYVDRVVTKDVYIVVRADEHYLKPTAIPQPPQKRTYAEGERPDFEELYRELVPVSTNLYKQLNACNADKFGAESDITAKSKKYDRPNASSN